MSGIGGGAGSKSGIIGQTELDYEEGSWSPGSNDGSFTYGINNGNWYVKIGQHVTLRFGGKNFTANNSSEIEISNLPFSPKDNYMVGGDVWTNSWSSEPGDTRFWNGASGVVKLYKSNGSGSVTALTYADIGTGGNFWFQIAYICSA